jgi:hypothetical protein
MEDNMLIHFLKRLILCFCFIAVVAHAEETDYERIEREASEKHMNRMKEELELMDVDIRFYGKVVDQYNNPVESADIVFYVTQFNPDMEKWFSETKYMQARTDTQGCFSVIGEKASDLYIKQIKKESYEFSLSQNPVRGYVYSGVQNPFVPDSTNPIVFHMRKMGETTFLIQEKYLKLCLYINKSIMTKGIDLIKRIKIDDFSKLMFNGEKLVCDLKMTATFNTRTMVWSVVLSPGDTNGGVIASEQLLYEAPQEGYQPEFSFVAEDRKPPVNKYLYLRSRDPLIYTRIEIEDICTDDTYICLYGQALTNPYGDRNLEQATDLPSSVTKQLSGEIRSAYKQNKRPVKPDLQKLINEAKEKSSQ